MQLSFRGIGWGVTAIALLAFAPGVVWAHKTHIVHVSTNVFTPEFVEVELGDTIRWVFDGTTHTTTSVDGLWDSGLLATGTFDYTPTATGQYDYFCTIHIDCCNMAGSIYVNSRGTAQQKQVNPSGKGSR